MFKKKDFNIKIQKLVKKAKKKDKEYKIFGSAHHKYAFNPPATMENIIRFEEKYKIKLPEAYVSFLTTVGNGGAGPEYGLYSLEELEKYNERLMQNESAETFIDEKLSVEKWNKAVKELEASDEMYDSVTQKITNGALVIGTQGCTYDNLLMCGGSEYGKIVYIDWNMLEDYPPVITGMTFEEWMTDYFQKVIDGDIEKCSDTLHIVKK